MSNGENKTNSGKVKSWAEVANEDIESAAAEEERNYDSANVKKLSPKVAAGVLIFFVAYTVALYYLFSGH